MEVTDASGSKLRFVNETRIEGGKLLRNTVWTFLAVFLLVFITAYVMSLRSVESGRESLRTNLIRKADLAAGLIDANAHQKFTSNEQASSNAYKKALEPLKHILEYDPDIAYIYTMIRKNGSYYFILDPTPENLKRPDGKQAKSEIMQPYESPTEAMKQAFDLNKNTVDLKPYSDDWGTFISAFSPIRDAAGAPIGIVGVDLEASQYQRLVQPYEELHRMVISESVLLSLLCATIVAFLRVVTFYGCFWLEKKLLD